MNIPWAGSVDSVLGSMRFTPSVGVAHERNLRNASMNCVSVSASAVRGRLQDDHDDESAGSPGGVHSERVDVGAPLDGGT